MANPIGFNELFDPLGPGTTELKDFTTAVQGLSRNYRAFAKVLESDGERVRAQLATVAGQAGQLREQVAGLDGLNDKQRTGLAALGAEVAKLVREQQRLKEVQEAQARIQRTVSDATGQARSALRGLQNELRDAYAAQDTARIEKAAQAIRTARTETVSLSAALRGSTSALTAAKGSYDALDAENKQLVASLKALGGGLGENNQQAARLQEQIQANTVKLKEFDEKILNFTRNVGNYRGGFSELVAELARARAAQAGLTQGTAAYGQQQQRVAGFQTAAQRAAAQMGLSYEQANAAIEQQVAALAPLAQALNRLEKEQLEVAATAGAESGGYRRVGVQVQATRKQLDDAAASTAKAGGGQQSLTSQLGFTREGLTQYAASLAVGAVGLAALGQGVQKVFEANVDYSRQLAEVRKTTGLTADEAERLAQSLKALDTPTSLEGLLKIATVGGQLGIAKNDLLAFTTAIDTAVQALGNDFQGGAEEIATVLGKIGSVYRKELGPDVAQNILSVGSAVNQIGADGAATAPFLTEVALRVGAIASSAKVGLPNVLAYAAVLQETGSTSEVAGTALNRFFSTLSNRTKEAYEIAKLANPALTLKDFTRLVNTDFNQAIQVFLRGLREGGKTTTDQSRLLATLKLQSGEAKNAIVTLAQNTDLFAQRQATANTQLRDATSLAQEAAVQTATLGGSVDKLGNDLKNFTTSGAVGSFLKFLVDAARDTFGAATGLSGFNGEIVKAAERSKALEADFTLQRVESAQAAGQQADAQEKLLKSYLDLQNQATRSAAQESELAQLRSQFIKQYGTDDAFAVQEAITRQRDQVEKAKATFQDYVTFYTKGVNEAAAAQSAAQNAVNEQNKKLTAEQIARAEQVAAFRAGKPLTGRSAVPELEGAIAANTRLNQSEATLAEQRRRLQLATDALNKLSPQTVKASQDGAAAADDEAKAQENLGRTEVENAKNRVAALKEQLAENQRQTAAAREFLKEQGQLFTERQLGAEQYAEAVAGAEDNITQSLYRGLVIQKLLIRAEANEQLAEAKKNEESQLKAKNLSLKEQLDIEGQYAEKSAGIRAERNRKIADAEREYVKSLKVDPLNIRLVGLDANNLRTLNKGYEDAFKVANKTYEETLDAIRGTATAEETLVTNQRAAGLISRQEYEDELLNIAERAADKELKARDDFHKADNAQDAAAARIKLARTEREEEKRRRVIERSLQAITALSQSAFDYQAAQLNAQAQLEQQSYDNSVKAAGDNKELLAEIERKHARESALIKRKQAELDRKAALFSILVNLGVAIARDLKDFPFPLSLAFIAADTVVAGLQTAAVLSAPLPEVPAYFKGRSGGPAEVALVAERGPELVGQPGSFRLAAEQQVMQLRAGDRVYTAPETSALMERHDIVEGRLVQRAQAADMERQTARLRQSAAARETAAQRAFDRANGQLIEEVRGVRRAVEEMEQVHLTERGLELWRQRQATWERHVTQKYRHGRQGR